MERVFLMPCPSAPTIPPSPSLRPSLILSLQGEEHPCGRASVGHQGRPPVTSFLPGSLIFTLALPFLLSLLLPMVAKWLLHPSVNHVLKELPQWLPMSGVLSEEVIRRDPRSSWSEGQGWENLVLQGARSLGEDGATLALSLEVHTWTYYMLPTGCRETRFSRPLFTKTDMKLWPSRIIGGGWSTASTCFPHLPIWQVVRKCRGRSNVWSS